MSTSVYNKIVSTINSASRDYNYSPDPNNLICIDTSNNRIGINTLDPTCSLHISGGNIMVNDIDCSSISAINYNYYNSISSGSYNNFVEDSISVTNVNASNVNSAIVNVSNTLDISNGRINANYIDISSILDISRGRIISKIIYSTNIDISSTLDISRGNIISNKISSVTIDISSMLDISRGHIISNKISTFNIDISGTLDISQGRITTKTIDVSSISVSSLLDISQGRIKAQTIDVSSIAVSSLLDISHGHIEAKTIDASAINVSSLFDINQGHIEAKTIDASAINVSALLDISQGRIKANTIDASAIAITSLLDISQVRIKAKTIDASAINVSSLLDISQGHIEAKTIDVSAINVSSLLDISRGTILANTISGSAITVNANAINSSNIVNITINNTNIGGININTILDEKAITINNVRVATTQHIEDAFPIGVIVAYNSTTPPYGWALCDGSNNTPDLRGRFILGGGLNTIAGAITVEDNSYVYHKFMTVGNYTFTSPFTGNGAIDVLIVGGGAGGQSALAGQSTFGGWGGQARVIVSDVIIGTSYSIVVGNGGGPNESGQGSSFNNNTSSGGLNNGINYVQQGTLITTFTIIDLSYYWGGSGGADINGSLNGGLGGGGGGGWLGDQTTGTGGIGGINNGIDGTSGSGGAGGANTGGGGGGGIVGGRGGSGIVIIRYLKSRLSLINGLTPRAINVSGGEETVMLDANTMPRHKHSNAARAQIGGLVRYDDSFDKVDVTDIISVTYPITNGVKNRTAGQTTGHENMPPFYVLVYIIKTSYDFCYNVVTFVPSVPSVPIILSVTDYIGSSDYGATINWIPPYDGGSPIIQYAIFVNFSFKDNALSTLTSKRIINMGSGINIIRIQAQNNIGYSLFSNEVTITIN